MSFDSHIFVYSFQVQEAVANCLPPLVPAIKADAPAIVKNLLALLLESENYGERKGAAYGLAGLVKGLGILSLKQLDIMSSLQDAIQDKKNFRRREGRLNPVQCEVTAVHTFKLVLTPCTLVT